MPKPFAPDPAPDNPHGPALRLLMERAIREGATTAVILFETESKLSAVSYPDSECLEEGMCARWLRNLEAAL